MSNPHFEVHPSVVFQLGESLISDAVQALIELVKNCYDADATYAKVTIDTNGVTEVENSIFPSTGGRIIIEDDGCGMGLNDIETGWLTISNRKKREMKESKKTTPGGRTPLGDKGLGRLGVQRLGQNLEIFTKSKGDCGYHFGFSWLDFETAPKLEDVNIHLAEVKFRRSHGTKVVVSDLKEPSLWRGKSELKRLEQTLSGMISPYKQIRDFTVIIEVDGKTFELLEISDSLREIAPVRYNLNFDGNRILFEGRASLDFFRPSTPKDVEVFAAIVEVDNGRTFFDFLKSQKQASALNLKHSSSGQWYVEFDWKRSLGDLDKVWRQTSGDTQLANPGAFTGEVEAFDLGATAFQALRGTAASVFDRISEYRQRIKELSGIKVYRDGFRVRLDHDWLKLGAQWTSASSYYGLKPDTTLGYIALSARDNLSLEETTDREGFKDTPYYRNFNRIMEEFMHFTSIVHDFFGRSWNEFKKLRNEVAAQVDSRKTVEDLSRAIRKGLAEAPRHQKVLGEFKARLTASAAASKEVVSRLRSSKEITPLLRERVAEAMSSLEPLLQEADAAITRLSTYLDEIGSLKDMGQVLEDRVEGLRRQMDDMYEAVALGLTAEALSHEVYNIADQMAKRAKAAQTAIRSKGITDRPVLAFVEYIQSSVLALRKQMSFLSPSLRFVREQRDEIDVYAFCDELAEFYRDRLEKSRITMTITSANRTPFLLKMNRGKFTQVIDNLILNSEYWLKEDIAQNRIKAGNITLEISRPFVRLVDNGSGIDQSVESTLFEPFVSAKLKGRGLGLFIVKQLLDSDGCSITLLPQRNARGRFFKFQIDLRGSLHD